MKRPRRKHSKQRAVPKRANRSSRRSEFGRVLRELEAVGKARPDADPLVERLRKCPETFVVGEMLGKMFDTLKYNLGSSEDGDRMIPPAGAVFPLV
jgi:hypothetical protein